MKQSGPRDHACTPSSSLPRNLYFQFRLFCLFQDPSLKVGLDGSLESLWVGTDDLADLVAVLEQEEGWHGADAELLGHLWDLVDVELVETGVGVGVGEPVAALSVTDNGDRGRIAVRD